MNHIKFCGCRACKRGLSRTFGKYMARAANRRHRHEAKRSLKEGKTPERLISVPYTD